MMAFWRLKVRVLGLLQTNLGSDGEVIGPSEHRLYDV